MIQRIQSIFLLLAAAAAFGTFGLPFASTAEPLTTSAMFSDSLFNIMDDMVVLGLLAAAGLLCLIAIFLFKNRSLQMRLSVLAMILGLVGIAYGTFSFYQNITSDTGITFELGSILPVLTIIFALLAYRFIKKDEKLVKSADRLR